MFAIFVFFFSLFSPATTSPSLSAGIDHYVHRADGAKGIRPNSAHISQAIENLEAAYAAGEQEQGGLYLLRAYHFQGRFATPSKSEKRAIYEKGKNLGESLVNKYTNNVEIRLEYVYMLGLWGDNIGIMKAATSGIVGKMKKHTEKAIELDPAYCGGAGYRVLGILHYQAPHIPFVLTWPDAKKAVGYLEKSVAYDPSDNSSYYYLAEACYQNGEEARARQLFNKVLKMPARKEWLLEDRQLVIDAKRMLSEMGG